LETPSGETNALLEKLVKSVEKGNSSVAQLQSSLSDLNEGVQVAPLSEGAKANLRRLKGIQEEALDVLAQKRILNSLAFDEMRYRVGQITEAHPGTFDWFYNDMPTRNETGFESPSSIKPTGNISEAKRDARSRFTNWLSSGTGIFHVSGRMGSGKSTLMKYLSGHSRTKGEIGNWAGRCSSQDTCKDARVSNVVC